MLRTLRYVCGNDGDESGNEDDEPVETTCHANDKEYNAHHERQNGNESHKVLDLLLHEKVKQLSEKRKSVL